jgi:acetyl-CoA synthetase
MLACVRIGAVHNVIFGGYSGNSIRERVEDAKAKLVVTADEGLRGEKVIHLKETVDEALDEGCESVSKVLVIRHTGGKCNMQKGRDVWFDEVLSDDHKGDCEPEIMNAEDPLFILYTSGSTGKPKGVLHTVAGYMIYVATTLKYAFDLKEDDIFWCTADIGWITGHSYVIYGPLLSGSTSVVCEGLLTYPDAGRSWDMVERHKVTIFYTAPTFIRVLEKEGDEFPEKYDLSSLRLLGSVGEPINPRPWLWYYRVIGKESCPIIDTYWQTETGGFLILPFPAAYPLKPGAACRPFFGVEPAILDDDGKDITDSNKSGHLVIKHSWPGMMRGVYGNPSMFRDKYLSRFAGYYETGDGARKDSDGDFWIFGRIDDVLNVSGHRLGTAEIEHALVSHEAVSEAAVVGIPDEVKGESICAYLVLKNGAQGSGELEDELRNFVREEVGPVATPSAIHFAPGLPKTRSGKIMRRVLKKIACGEKEDLGDLSSLANSEVVESLKNL